MLLNTLSRYRKRRNGMSTPLVKVQEFIVIASSRYLRATSRNLKVQAGTPRDQHRRSRNSTPIKEDLPRILTAAGMVKLCMKPENQSLPLVGLDVAPTNFGVAISDETRTFALPVMRVLRRDPGKKLDPSEALRKLGKLIEESNACALVVGWPLSRSGAAKGQCLMVLQFLRQLRLKGKIDIPVTLWDERLTSVEARDILREDGLGRRATDLEDEIAAMVILQGFLDSAEADRGGLSTLHTEPREN
ncbi:unnamed protein product [Ascophyllum nodosum]